MADISKIRPIILQWEGGFQKDPNDRANYTADGTLVGTNKGVSANTFERIFGVKPTEDDIKNLTDEQFDEVLEHFGKSIRYDDIENQSIADIYFDWVWASGSYYPTKDVQQLVHAASDGVVGQHTVDAINEYPNQEELFDAIKSMRLNFIDGLIINHPEWSTWEQGWKNRVNSYNFS